MPHHWKPADPVAPAQGGKTLKYHGSDKDKKETWELWEIGEKEAEDLEKKPKKHDCERVLYP
jgi:hypothetical protein